MRVRRIAGWAQRLLRFTNSDRPWAPPLPDPGLVLGLAAVLDEEQPDLVHGHDWLGRSAAILCRRRHIPFVSSLHYYTRTSAKKTLVRDGAPCPGPGLLRCARCTAGHYGAVRGPATAAANWLGSRLEDAVAAAYLPVSEATAVGNGLPDSARSWRVVPNPLPEMPDEPGPLPDAVPDGPFILYVGDLRPEKGVPVLLAAYGELVDAPPLVLVGETFADAPSDLPPGCVAVGRVPHELVGALWRRATVAVVPSVWAEPFGIVVVEAMAAGSRSSRPTSAASPRSSSTG